MREVNLSKTDATRQFIIVTVIIGIILIIIGSVLTAYTLNFEFILIIVFGALVLFIAILIAIIVNLFPSKREEYIPQEVNTESKVISKERAIMDAIILEISSNEDLNATIVTEEYLFYFTIENSAPKKAKCMITKMKFDDNDIILQCPSCLNYFKKKYLLDWLEANNNCPVCKTELKRKLEFLND